ncbi:MAG: YitT family protein [Faecalibacterium sp.]
MISTKADELCAAILHQLDRGVTILNGAGGYTHDPSAVLLSVISSRELPRLEKLVHAIDPDCFLIVSPGHQRCGAAASPWIKISVSTQRKNPPEIPGIFAYAYSKGAMALTSRPVRREQGLSLPDALCGGFHRAALGQCPLEVVFNGRDAGGVHHPDRILKVVVEAAVIQIDGAHHGLTVIPPQRPWREQSPAPTLKF